MVTNSLSPTPVHIYQSGASWDATPASGREGPTNHPGLDHILQERGGTLAWLLALHVREGGKGEGEGRCVRHGLLST